METPLHILTEAKQQLIERIRQHSFLRRCRQQEITLDELKIFLVQQGVYSGNFTRYLCAMMANLPQTDYVLRVADNLCDELGLTRDHTTQHTASYRQMLGFFELSLEGARPLPGTRRLIDTMFDNCRDLKAARGLGALCLGAEALVPAVYGDILVGFQGCDVPAGSLEFFHKHVECDDGHAEVMWNIMVELGTQDPDQLPLMVNAGAAMIDARMSFFSSVESAFAAATRTARVDAA